MADIFIEGFKKQVIEIPVVNLIYVDKDGVCVSREYDFFIVLKFEALNLALLTEDEKKDFAEKFMEILNTVHNSKKVILYSETKPLDIGMTIKEFDEATRRIVLTKGAQSVYAQYLQQQQLLWVNYASTTRIVNSYMSVFYKSPVLERKDKISAYQTARSTLLTTGSALITKFDSIGVLAKILDAKEILKEVWEFLHPKSSSFYEKKELDRLSLDNFVVTSTRRLYEV